MNASPDGAAPQEAKVKSLLEGNAAYPLALPNAWMEHEKFCANFSRVAAGWQNVESAEAAANISKAMGSPMTAVENLPEPGRLFVAGDIGHIGTSEASGNLQETIHKIGDGLGLIGAFSVESTNASLAGNVVRVQQTIEGLPIYGAQFAVHVDHKGMAYAIAGTPAPKDLDIPELSKKLGLKEAIDVVASTLGKSVDDLAYYRAEELFLPVECELHRCYFVRAISRRPLGDWRGFVGLDGEILGLFNIASGASGKASGYRVDPLRSPSVEDLELIGLINPPIALTGPRTEIWGPDQSRVSSPNGHFLYEPRQSEFDEPQIYYFLQVCWDAINRLAQASPQSLMNETRFKPIKANVHVQDAQNNAYYAPDNGELYFGDTTDDIPRCSSRCLDLVLHEFGHAVSDSMCELGRAKLHDSSRAMSEGFSDYFAATVMNDPAIGEYFAPGRSRSCANQAKFPRSFAGDEHEIGTIWAGLLWDLRQQAGQAADAIALQSLSYLGPWRTIIQGVDALVQADRVLFPKGNEKTGEHEQLIRAAFKNRTQ